MLLGKHRAISHWMGVPKNRGKCKSVNIWLHRGDSLSMSSVVWQVVNHSYGYRKSGCIIRFNGCTCGFGPLLVLVSPCFRETVVVTCKIGSFLCSSDNLIQKNVIVFFFENQISKWRTLEKEGYFWPTFHIFLLRGESYKNSFCTYLTHIHTYFAHPIDFFCVTNFEKNTNLSGMISLWYETWCWFLFAPFWNNQ